MTALDRLLRNLRPADHRFDVGLRPLHLIGPHGQHQIDTAAARLLELPHPCADRLETFRQIALDAALEEKDEIIRAFMGAELARPQRLLQHGG